MAKQRFIKTDLWADPYFEELDSSEKLMYIYLMTNEQVDLCGIYKISIKRISDETWFNKSQVELILNRFSKDDKVHYVENYICVSDFLSHQNTNNDKIIAGIARSVNSIPQTAIESIFGLSSQYISHIWPMYKSSHFTLLNLTLPNSTQPENLDWDFEEKKETIILPEQDRKEKPPKDSATPQREEMFNEFRSAYPNKKWKDGAMKKYKSTWWKEWKHQDMMKYLQNYKDEKVRLKKAWEFVPSRQQGSTFINSWHLDYTESHEEEEALDPSEIAEKNRLEHEENMRKLLASKY